MKPKTAVTNGNGTNPVAVLPPVQPVPATQRRMILSAISESKNSGTEKIVLFAPEGWGKSTFASQSEAPVFIAPEDGLKNIRVPCFPEPKAWQDMFDAVNELRTQDHAFKTLVVDTLDWSEHLCHAFLLDRDKKTSIDDYGYGKGYVLAFEEWKKLIAPLDALRREKNMHIILLAHTAIRTFNNPAGENFDRWELKLDRRISSLVKEWADAVLFGSYDIAVDVKKGQSKGKGYGGDRIIHANHSPAFDAKNRYGITEPIPADFKTFWGYVKGGQTNG